MGTSNYSVEFKRDTARVWTTPAVQEVSDGNAHRSGASMCPACSRSTTWLLALMKSAGRVPG